MSGLYLPRSFLFIIIPQFSICIYVNVSLWFITCFNHILFVEDTIAQERIWSLVSQNEPSVVPISMVSFTWPAPSCLFSVSQSSTITEICCINYNHLSIVRVIVLYYFLVISNI